jgi:hypothetical protein
MIDELMNIHPNCNQSITPNEIENRLIDAAAFFSQCYEFSLKQKFEVVAGIEIKRWTTEYMILHTIANSNKQGRQ